MSDRPVIGVDPGLKGGLAVIGGRGELLELAGMPLRRVGGVVKGQASFSIIACVILAR